MIFVTKTLLPIKTRFDKLITVLMSRDKSDRSPDGLTSATKEVLKSIAQYLGADSIYHESDLPRLPL